MANLSVLPSPEFFDQMEQLSTKKERGAPRCKPPPKPPVKSGTQISRFFQVHQPSSHKALAVSFQSPDSSIVSKHYDVSSVQTYFSQCFQIVGKLGTGSFGEVFKVKSKEDNKFYAVKKSRVPFRGERDRLRKLEEVRKHEQLPMHPHCVQFVKAWEEQQHLYIQTELCETSLSDITEINHDISEALVWKYLADLLLAVKHLHDHNLAHMDIKPDNIFISHDGICKLGDFGLVLDITKNDVSEAIEGDPKYLAPELLESKFTMAADVFSLGITLLELACDLNLPMGGPVWHDFRQDRIPSDVTLHLSRDLKNVICKMMTADYTQRPSIDKLLASHAVSKVLKKRRSELFVKHIISTVVMVTFSIVSAIQETILWPWRRVINLVDNCFSEHESDEDDVNDLQSWKHSAPDAEKQASEFFNVSPPSFDNPLSQSTPILLRHRNSPQIDGSQEPDLASRTYYSYSFSPNPSERSVAETNFSNNEERNHSIIVPRNLTQMFDSFSDED